MKKISTRFALMMAAAAVVPLLAYGAVSILSVRAGAQRVVKQGNQDVARRVGEQIEAYVIDNVRILKALAAQLNGTALTAQQQDRILKNFDADFAEFQRLTLIDNLGRPVVSSRTELVPTAIPGAGSLTIYLGIFSCLDIVFDLV
jgi:hypothetical protein